MNRSRRSAPMRASMSSICSSIARAERRSASSASCFCFSAASSGLAESATAGFLRLRRQLGEPFGRGFEPRRQIDDDRLQLDGERVVGGAQTHEIGIGEAVRLQRRFDVGDGRARRIEGLARRVVAGGAGRARAMSTTTSSRRKARRADKRTSTVIRRWRRPSGKGPWPRCGRNRPKRRFRREPFTLERENGCAGARALLKETANTRKLP